MPPSRPPLSVGFAADISAFVEKTKVKADLVLQKVALDMLAGVITRSPVDTGFFRANWRVGINHVDLSGPTDNPAGTPFTTSGAGEASILQARFGDVIFITNNTVYALALENGHSGQAPQGVMRITFEDVTARLDATIRKVTS